MRRGDDSRPFLLGRLFGGRRWLRLKLREHWIGGEPGAGDRRVGGLRPYRHCLCLISGERDRQRGLAGAVEGQLTGRAAVLSKRRFCFRSWRIGLDPHGFCWRAGLQEAQARQRGRAGGQAEAAYRHRADPTHDHAHHSIQFGTACRFKCGDRKVMALVGGQTWAGEMAGFGNFKFAPLDGGR